MNITVIGTTDQPYTTAWHYAWAFEQLGHGVVRKDQRGVGAMLVFGDGHCSVSIGRRAGLPHGALAPFSKAPFFTDDGVYAESYPTAHYLRSACHGPEAHDSEPYPPWEPLWDVAFVGRGNVPEWPHRAELIAHLREWYGDRFLHLGPGGQTVTDDSQNVHADLRGHWLNRLLRSVGGVVVVDSLFHDPLLPYWSSFVYEGWARGAFVLHPANHLLADELGGAMPWWDAAGDHPWEHLNEMTRWWLDRPIDREETRRRMQETVRTRCTYEVRAAELLAMLGA